MLELLQYEMFRKEIMNAQCAKFIDDQQLLHWQHYQWKRQKLIQEQADKHAAANQKWHMDKFITLKIDTNI